MSNRSLTTQDRPFPFSPLAYEPHQSVTLGAGVYTYNIPLNANEVAVQALTQNVRYTLDGSAPTSTRGFQLKAGDPPVILPVTSTVTMRFIRETSGAILEIQAGS